MKTFKTTLAVTTAALLAASSAHAIKTDKINLKGNMTLEYLKTPGKVESLGEMFTEGMLYGRLRMNTFYWDWNTEGGNNQDNKAMGVGGSLVYKTAQFSGLSATLGMYTSQNPDFFRMDKDEVGTVKAGKDTFERNKVKNGGTFDGHFGMTTVAQAYLKYDRGNTSVIAGRQMFESVFTKSNDTKMIPNAFDGITVTNTDVPDTKLQFAYFTAHKLRDHTDSHDVIAFDSWNENDDSA
ncbi:MAG: OprD family outer membrane porin, partial [Sulfurimonadaceae bacterium]|nr:OprD family outer membrane porin [Sulfurimonadaceae bacterium]